MVEHVKGWEYINQKATKGSLANGYPPKDEGGLGVLNLTVQNESLLLKHLHKFYNRVQVPWVQLVWDKYHTRDKLPMQGENF